MFTAVSLPKYGATLLFLQLFLAASLCLAFTPPRMESRQQFSSTAIHEDSPASTTPDVAFHKFLVHWKGERSLNYSKQFRQLEFTSSFSAQFNMAHEVPKLDFINALNYSGSVMPDTDVEDFNDAMQYISLSSRHPDARDAAIASAARCSLVHGLYEVIAVGDSYDELAHQAIVNGGFRDMYQGSCNEDMSWCLRVRSYGDFAGLDKDKRYGSRSRSMSREKEALNALKRLLILFGGSVDLVKPDCKIYVFDGLRGNQKVLARRIASGPVTSSIAPNTRICVTTTPLCDIAAYLMCNVAQIRDGNAILDTFAGSCATLLAASMIAPRCRTVGIEIAHSGYVNRDDIGKDFDKRGLPQPVGLLRGDSSDPSIRDKARAAIGNRAFDAIITDPPYGIREASSCNSSSPLEQLFAAIARDYEAGTPLLKKGGRLSVFVPVTAEQTLVENLPHRSLETEAGLRFESSMEQFLNEKLSRYLVCYVCTR